MPVRKRGGCQQCTNTPCHDRWLSTIKSSQLNQPRFIVGQLLELIAALMYAFGDYPTAGVAAIAALGLISIATARR